MAKNEMTPQAYAEFVAGRFDEAANSGLPIVFTNRGTMHARSVLSQLVTRSRVTLRLFTGQLSSSAYDPSELRMAARTLSGSVRVLLGDEGPYTSESSLIHLRAEMDSGKIEVKCLYPTLTQLGYKESVAHFAIGDNKNIRVEEDAANRSATVVLNYDGSPQSSKLESYASLFDSLWNICPPKTYTAIFPSN